jgi:hypothetical protein
MINYRKFKNPFDWSDFEEKQLPALTGQSIHDFSKPDLKPGFDIVYNDRVISREESRSIIPTAGDTFALVARVAGGGQSQKNVMQSVAMLALMFTTMGIGSLASGGAFMGSGFLAASSWSIWGYLAAIGVMAVGGQLMSQWFPTPEMDTVDPTYSWGSIPPMAREGGAVQMTFGTVKVGACGQAQIIACRVTYDGDKSYLNFLASGGEGPCDYTGDGEYDPEDGAVNACSGIPLAGIKINDNAIANFRDVKVYLRAGLNNQSVIPNFADTYEDKSLSYELIQGAEWSQDTTTGNGGEGLEVTLNFPLGLCKVDKNSGNYQKTDVKVEIQYKLHSDVDWIDFEAPYPVKAYYNNLAFHFVAQYGDLTAIFQAGKTVTMKGSSSSVTATIVSSAYVGGLLATDVVVDQAIPAGLYEVEIASSVVYIAASSKKPFWRTLRIDNVAAGQYDVRVRCTYKQGTGDYYYNDVYWTRLSHVIYDDFAFPNKILIGIRALATDQLNGGLQSITWEQTKSKVWVWVPTDPADPWGAGEYQEKDAFNPAWAAYHMAHKCYQLYDINAAAMVHVVKGIPANRIIYSEFAAWAAFCTANDLRCDLLLDKTQSLWDALKLPESVGRGKVIQRGTKLGCFCDKEETGITQLFTVANIGSDGLRGCFIGKEDRANALEVSFLDEDRDYKKVTFPFFGEDYDASTAISNPTQIFLQPCTRMAQAWKEANYRLRLNKYIIRSASWPVSVDSIACRVGDVVGVQVIKWGIGGRVQAVGADSITVPKHVNHLTGEVEGITLTPGTTYYCRIRLANDTFLTKEVASVTNNADNDVIIFTEPFVEDSDAAVYVDGTHFTVERDATADYTAGVENLVLYGEYGDIYVCNIVGATFNAGTGLTTVEASYVPSDLAVSRFAFTKPDPDDLFTFGAVDADCKKFRLTSIKRNKDLTATLSGIEYIPEVYNENTDVPTIDFTPDPTVESLQVNGYIDEGGAPWLEISWLPPHEVYYGARVEVNGKRVFRGGLQDYSFRYPVESIGLYQITVTTLDLFGNDAGSVTVEYELTLNAPPAAIDVADQAMAASVKGFEFTII